MIQVDPLDFISEENRELAMKEAREHGLPFVAYALKLADAQLTVKRHADESGIPEVEFRARAKVIKAKEKERPEVTLDTPLTELDLSGYCVNPLRGEGINTIRDALSRTEAQLLKVERFGMKTFDELADKLMELGIIVATSQFGEFDNESETNHESDSSEDEAVPEEDERSEPVAAEAEGERDLPDRLQAGEDGDEDRSEPEESGDEPESDMERGFAEIRLASKRFTDAWGLSPEAAVKQLRGITEGVLVRHDPDTYPETVELIEGHMPISDELTEQVMELGSQLGEEQQYTRITRPEATFGAPLNKLTVFDAQELITDMEFELNKRRQEDVIEDDEEEFWTSNF